MRTEKASTSFRTTLTPFNSVGKTGLQENDETKLWKCKVSQQLQVDRYLSFCEHNPRASSKTSEVMFHILKHEIKTTRHSRGDQTLQLHHIWMIQSAQHLNFSSHEAHTFGFQVIKTHLLQSYNSACLKISCLVHIAVCPLPNLHICKTCWWRPTYIRDMFVHGFEGHHHHSLGLAEAKALSSPLKTPFSSSEKLLETHFFSRANLLTLSSFSKDAACRGIQPLIASPATADSHAGQPAATCSPPSRLLRGTLLDLLWRASPCSLLSLLLSRASSNTACEVPLLLLCLLLTFTTRPFSFSNTTTTGSSCCCCFFFSNAEAAAATVETTTAAGGATLLFFSLGLFKSSFDTFCFPKAQPMAVLLEGTLSLSNRNLDELHKTKLPSEWTTILPLLLLPLLLASLPLHCHCPESLSLHCKTQEDTETTTLPAKHMGSTLATTQSS